MKQYKWRVTISPSFVSQYVYFSLNSPLPSLRPAIVSAATCTLSSPVSLHSSAAPIICITWQIQRAWRCFCVWACAPFVCGTAAAPARVQAGPCVRACVHLRTLSFSFFFFFRWWSGSVGGIWWFPDFGSGFIWCWDGSCWPKEFIHVCIICLSAQNKHGTLDIFYPSNLTWHKQNVHALASELLDFNSRGLR